MAITLDRLTKYYGKRLGVEDLTFTVEAGEVFGFLGPNGSGKTTTLRTLMGLINATSGSGPGWSNFSSAVWCSLARR